MGPRIWRQCSFADWMKRCGAMDEWEKSLRTMPYCDWTIHRKLGEESGLAHRYIVPARGSGKSIFVDSFDEVYFKDSGTGEYDFYTKNIEVIK